MENGVIKRFVLDPYKWYCYAVLDIAKKYGKGEDAPKENAKRQDKQTAPNDTQSDKPKKNKFFYGKKFCFATKLERTIPLKMYQIVDMIYKLGGEYTENPAECQVFVKHKNGKCHRTNYAFAHKNIKIVPFEQLLDLMGVKYADIEPYDFKGDYVGKKPKPIETGVSHVEKTPTSIGEHIKNKDNRQTRAVTENKDNKQKSSFKNKKRFWGKKQFDNKKKKQNVNSGENNESGTDKNNKKGD